MKVLVLLSDPESRLPVEIDARDRRAFERDGTAALKLKGQLKDIIHAAPETYVAWLAWHALTRTGALNIPWTSFDKRLVAVENEDEQDDVEGELGDPTQSGATPD